MELKAIATWEGVVPGATPVEVKVTVTTPGVTRGNVLVTVMLAGYPEKIVVVV